MIRLKKYFAVSALSSVLCWSSSLSAAEPLEDPLTTTETSPTLIQQKSPIHALRSAPLQLNLHRLQQSVQQFRQVPDKPEAITLKLFDDMELTIVPERIEGKNDKTFNLIGKLQQKEEGHAIFVVKDGNIVGNIRTDGKLFKIRPTGDGSHEVIDVDLSKMPAEHPDDFGEEEIPEAQDSSSDADTDNGSDIMLAEIKPQLSPQLNSSQLTLLLPPKKAKPFITVMVLYSNNAKAADPFIEQEIELTILETNYTYARSGVTQRLSLSYVGHVNYNDSGNLKTDRNRLKNPADGHMDHIHALRNKYKADVVNLWLNNGSYCGYAYIQKSVNHSFQSSAFSTVKRSCANGNYSFAHELGHNMGARHDRYVDPTENSPYAYNHGQTNVANNWRTIMAYNNRCSDNGTYCSRIGYWSTPHRNYAGAPLGIANHIDNRRTLNNTATTVAGFRQLGVNENGDNMGHAVASGDFNGDGYLDLAIAAPYESPGADPKSGYVFIYRGGPYGLAPWHGLDQAGLGNNENLDRFGSSLAVGDFNNDGRDDLAVGAPGEAPGADPKSGYVFVFKGWKNGLTAWKGLQQTGIGVNEAGDNFGYSLATGDFDGDGKADLAVGAPYEDYAGANMTGRVYTYRGSFGGPIAWKSLGQASLGSTEAGDRFGFALAAGDFDNDGKDDLAVGAPYESPASDPQSGYVFIFRGNISGLHAWQGLDQAGLGANEAYDKFGYTLVTGDFNGDNHDDLAIGAPGEAPGADPRSGYVFTFQGAAAGLVAWQGISQAGLGSNEAGDYFGRSLAAGDINNDGKSELLVGAPYEAPGSNPKSGYAFVFKGNATGLTTWKGLDQGSLGSNEAGDRFAWSLAMGDFNNDGRDDIAIGAPGEAPGADPRSGYTFIFQGSALGPRAWHGLSQEM